MTQAFTLYRLADDAQRHQSSPHGPQLHSQRLATSRLEALRERISHCPRCS